MQNLATLMNKLADLGHATIGQGWRHPASRNTGIQDEIDRFLQRHPYLRQDQGYIDFLEMYAGAMVDYPDGSLTISIFGFLDNLSLHLTKDEEFSGPAIDENGFFMFCSSVVAGKTSLGKHESIGLDYAFDATGTRPWGVYRSMTTSDQPTIAYEWYAASFLDWLAELVDKKGELF
jgi:hypothetical protein